MWSVFCYFLFPLIVSLVVFVAFVVHHWDGPDGIAMYLTKIIRERQRIRKMQEAGMDVL